MKAWVKLLLGISAIGLVWLVLLPQIGRWTPVRQHIDHMRSADIEVDAMFYSELRGVPGL